MPLKTIIDKSRTCIAPSAHVPLEYSKGLNIVRVIIHAILFEVLVSLYPYLCYLYPYISINNRFSQSVCTKRLIANVVQGHMRAF